MLKIIDLSNGFWNIRGSFKVGAVEIGTHVSLVRLQSGDFVFLDSYTLDDETAQQVDEIVGDSRVAAILNLHPFHTLHVRAMHARYPQAKLYGTSRHHARFEDLPWEPELTEDEALHARFAADFTFTVPRGVDLVPSNPHLHFASVMAYHPASKTWHIDDTLIYVRLPKILRRVREDMLRFHPTLKKVLQRRPDAVEDFRAWARELIASSRDARNLCAAHSAVLRADEGVIAARIEGALSRAEKALRKHERAHQ